MDLQLWGETLFGIPPAEPGLGTSWKIETNFPIPAWGLLLFMFLAVGVVTWTYRRDGRGLSRTVRGSLILLRLCSLACILFFLSGAVVSLERTSLPYLLVLIDNSRSMDTPDQWDNGELRKLSFNWTSEQRNGSPPAPDSHAPTRLELAKGLLTGNNSGFSRALLGSHKLRFYTFSDSVQRLGGDILNEDDLLEIQSRIRTIETSGNQTHPGAAVRELMEDLRGSLPTGMIVLSDGVNTGEESERLSVAADTAASNGVVLMNIGFGNSTPIPDLSISDTLVDEVAFIDDPITFKTRVGKSGDFGGKVRVRLKQVGSEASLAETDVQLLDAKEPVSVELNYTPRSAGDFEYIVEVDPLEREFRIDNNQERRQVSVRNEKIRVLLVDSSPRYEYRYLKHLLEREKTVELSSVLQESAPEYATEDRTALPHFPVRNEELFSYDVVILGDVDPEQIGASSLEQIRAFVSEKGGGVVFVAGSRFNPRALRGSSLEVLLPMELDSLGPSSADMLVSESSPVSLTPEGRHGSGMFRLADSETENQSVWEHLPQIFWFLRLEKLKSGAVPFVSISPSEAQGSRLPLIVMQRFGAGKVLFHATDETWRWRFRVGDKYFGRFWIQAIRSLARARLSSQDRQLILTADRSRYELGERINLRAQFLDARVAPAGNNPVLVMIEKAGAPGRKVELKRKNQSETLFEASVSELPEGTYHAFVTEPVAGKSPPAVDFRIEIPVKEVSRLEMDLGELELAAKKTDGHFLNWSDAEKLPQLIPPGRPVTLRSEEPITLWNHWIGLILLATILSAEWILRKRNRLL